METLAICTGQVYSFAPDASGNGRGALSLAMEPLRITATHDGPRLVGPHVRVRNAAAFQRAHPSGRVVDEQVGDARPNEGGHFVFRPRSGGGRLDKLAVPDAAFVERYSEASHFGEVNAYYH